MSKVVAIMPIKLNNERLPGKNTKLLNGKPLIKYELENLLKVSGIEEIYVFCSSEEIVPFLPSGVRFLKRPEELDLPTSNFTQIFNKFKEIVQAEIYVYAHATAPFISVNTIQECLAAVEGGDFDSAFCATKIQDYLWKNGEPLNFDASNIPRSQDIEPIYRETSGVYVFKNEVFEKYKRRIGKKPYICELGYKEAVDINNLSDFELAEALINIDI